MEIVRWAPWVLIALTACGRINYDRIGEPDDGGIDGTPDTVIGDDAPACVADPCVLLLPQCGCADTQMCQRTGATTEERTCVARGSVPVDQGCTLDALCVPGHACLAYTATMGSCHLYCDDDTDCAVGLECARYDEGVGVGVCGSACTLDGGCGAGNACRVNLVFDFDSGGGVALPMCAPSAGAAIGQACVGGVDCAAGAFCDEMGICRAFCRKDGSLPCATGTCTDPIVPVRLGNVLHGFCR